MTATTVAQASRPVDVVVMLDTSGSMEQLLDATRARVWDVVNELGRMRPTPEVRVGLMSFGTDQVGPEAGYIIHHIDLTDDLDEVYGELMSLTASGEHELVGRALTEAVDQMNWSPEYDALRVIFIAGNESADQGVEDAGFRLAARVAKDRDIIINALYAGNRDQAVVEKWPEIARAGRGNFTAIDPTTGTIQIAG
jgi:Mg-chelatase subunit ChlD